MMIEAIQLNNAGALQVSSGRYREALMDLKQAAELMYSTTKKTVEGGDDEIATQSNSRHDNNNNKKDALIANRSSNRKTQRFDDCPQDDKVRRKRAKRSSGDCEQQSGGHVRPTPRKSQESCFLRTKPFFIATVNTTYTEVSTAILFNMALTYQLSFIECCSLPKSIENASGLYGMAGSIAMRHLEKPSFTRLLMASLNNLAFLYFELGNYGLAKEYFDEMSRCIVNVNPQALTTEVRREKDELLLNTMVMKEPHAARAA